MLNFCSISISKKLLSKNSTQPPLQLVEVPLAAQYTSCASLKSHFSWGVRSGTSWEFAGKPSKHLQMNGRLEILHPASNCRFISSIGWKSNVYTIQYTFVKSKTVQMLSRILLSSVPVLQNPGEKKH